MKCERLSMAKTCEILVDALAVDEKKPNTPAYNLFEELYSEYIRINNIIKDMTKLLIE
jgi:hypothetical protein